MKERNHKYGKQHKPLLAAATLFLALGGAGLAQSPADEGYAVAARGPDDRVWTRLAWETNSAGLGVLTTNSFIEVSTGVSYWDGGWKDSQDLIELMPDGTAAAVHGSLKAYFSANLNTRGAIRLVTRADRTFETEPIGLFYYDSASGKEVRLASLRDCPAQLLPPNQIVWKGIFDSIDADLRVTYTKAAVETLLILGQRPKPPSFYGLNPATTRLELWHEWHNAPQPEQRQVVLDGALGFVDWMLDFGICRSPVATRSACAETSKSRPERPQPSGYPTETSRARFPWPRSGIARRAPIRAS